MSESGALYPGTSSQRATTGPLGFALQNATPTIIAYNVPNDGKLHSIEIDAVLVVSVVEVGGSITVNFTVGGVAGSYTLFSGGLGVGANAASTTKTIVADPGSAVTIVQGAALTSGASALYAIINGV